MVRHPLLPSIKDTSFFAVALTVIALDQVIKAAIVALPGDFSKPLLGPVLTIMHVRNLGASFGILQGRTVFLIIFACIVILLLLLYYRHTPEQMHSFLALILGGTVGNLIDRFRFGYVIDYIAIPYWPAFNLADIAISIGALFLIVYLWKEDYALTHRLSADKRGKGASLRGGAAGNRKGHPTRTRP